MKRSFAVNLVLAILGGLIGIFYLLFLAKGIYAAVVFPREPQRVTLARAVMLDLARKPDAWIYDKALYVSITDAVWECSSVRQSGYASIFRDRRRTDAVFTDAGKSAVVFIQVNGFYSCKDLENYEPLGELQRLDERPITYQSDASGKTSIDENSGVRAYFFCIHCTPSEAILMPICSVLLPLFVWAYYKYGRRGS